MRDKSSFTAASYKSASSFRSLAGDAGLAPPSGHRVDLWGMCRLVAAAKKEKEKKTKKNPHEQEKQQFHLVVTRGNCTFTVSSFFHIVMF